MSHHTRGDGKEVRAVLPAHPTQGDEAQIGLAVGTREWSSRSARKRRRATPLRSLYTAAIRRLSAAASPRPHAASNPVTLSFRGTELIVGPSMLLPPENDEPLLPTPALLTCARGYTSSTQPLGNPKRMARLEWGSD
jgi:hypothetical protein